MALLKADLADESFSEEIKEDLRKRLEIATNQLAALAGVNEQLNKAYRDFLGLGDDVEDEAAKRGGRKRRGRSP